MNECMHVGLWVLKQLKVSMTTAFDLWRRIDEKNERTS